MLSNPELFSTKASTTAQAVLSNDAVSAAAAQSTIQDRIMGDKLIMLLMIVALQGFELSGNVCMLL